MPIRLQFSDSYVIRLVAKDSCFFFSLFPFFLFANLPCTCTGNRKSIQFYRTFSIIIFYFVLYILFCFVWVWFIRSQSAIIRPDNTHSYSLSNVLFVYAHCFVKGAACCHFSLFYFAFSLFFFCLLLFLLHLCYYYYYYYIVLSLFRWLIVMGLLAIKKIGSHRIWKQYYFHWANSIICLFLTRLLCCCFFSFFSPSILLSINILSQHRLLDKAHNTYAKTKNNSKRNSEMITMQKDMFNISCILAQSNCYIGLFGLFLLMKMGTPHTTNETVSIFCILFFYQCSVSALSMVHCFYFT